MSRSSTNRQSSVKVSKVRKEQIVDLLDLDLKVILETGLREHLHDLLKLFAEILLSQEVGELVGRRGERIQERTASRWGSQPGFANLLEQKVSIDKPRVRTAGKNGSEINLQMYDALTDPSFLNEQAGTKLLAGLSTRNVSKTLETMLDGRGIGRQTISNRGIKQMAEQLELFKNRSFGKLDFVVIFIDGVGLADRLFVTAVGLDKTGAKHVLGFEQGSTESSHICRNLLSNLIERGILNPDGGHLFAVDGGKGLRKAIHDVFGKTVAVQRCVQHKKRNVVAKLPQHVHKTFLGKFAAAYSKKTFKGAQNAFDKLRQELEMAGYSSAASSLLEGNQELLTLHHLKIDGMLRKSLCTTNIIESLFSNARYQTRNVKRWRKEEQMERWLAASLLKAEKSLRRVPGYTQMSKLIAALRPEETVKA
jgi:transposase-like protein